MKTIVIANQKGGSGKSTSTVHLAVAAEQAGDGPVLISDTDPQGTTGDWFNQRKKAGFETPLYAPLPFSDLTDICAPSKMPAQATCLSTPPLPLVASTLISLPSPISS